MKNERWIADALRQLSEQDLQRQLPPETPPVPRRTTVNFSSNDYLGLRRNPDVIRTAVAYLRRFGTSAGASRLLSGSLECHRELEELLAQFKGYPASLLFGSGYLANCGVVPALVGRGDVVVADRLVHASLVDSILLSGARLLRFRHNDPEHLDALLDKSVGRRKLVVTESVFSMDGDVAPLKEVVSVAVRHGAMVFVDEAHATGIFGREGSGLVCAESLCESVNISMGTLSKALASYGGFVCCSSAMKDFLINRARTFIYSTALPPSAAGAAIAALNQTPSRRRLPPVAPRIIIPQAPCLRRTQRGVRPKPDCAPHCRRQSECLGPGRTPASRRFVGPCYQTTDRSAGHVARPVLDHTPDVTRNLTGMCRYRNQDIGLV